MASVPDFLALSPRPASFLRAGELMFTPLGVITPSPKAVDLLRQRALAVDAHLLVHHRDLQRQRGVRRRHEEVAQRDDLVGKRHDGQYSEPLTAAAKRELRRTTG